MGYIGLNMDFEWAMSGYVYGIAHGIPMQRKMRWDRMDYKYNGRDIYIYHMTYVFASICIYVCIYDICMYKKHNGDDGIP